MTRPRHYFSIAASTLVTILVSAGCGGSSPGQTLVGQKCDVVTHDDFPPVNLTVEKPAECPIYIPGANYGVTFLETGTFGPGQLGDYGLTFYNAANQFLNAQWSAISSVCAPFSSCSEDRLTVSGIYPAGTAGFGGSQTDRAVNDIVLSGRRRLATAMLTYQQSQAVRIVGPSAVLPYENFTLDGDLNYANAVPPLSWVWRRNGLQIGSSESLSYSGGAPGEWLFFDVQVTDGGGQAWNTSYNVHTKSCNTPACVDQ